MIQNMALDIDNIKVISYFMSSLSLSNLISRTVFDDFYKFFQYDASEKILIFKSIITNFEKFYMGEDL